MKFLFFFLSLFLLSACHRSSLEDITLIEQLPMATKIGANTAGCLVNGQILIPRGQKIQSGPVLSAQYQYLNGAYHFGLNITDNSNNDVKSIGIGSHLIDLKQGETYDLSENLNDDTLVNIYANYADFNASFYRTTEVSRGKLTVSYLDTKNYIISGTFWFDAVNNNGENVKVSEGRFDLHYAP